MGSYPAIWVPTTRSEERPLLRVRQRPSRRHLAVERFPLLKQASDPSPRPRAAQELPRSRAGFHRTSHRWPSGSWKYPE